MHNWKHSPYAHSSSFVLIWLLITFLFTLKSVLIWLIHYAVTQVPWQEVHLLFTAISAAFSIKPGMWLTLNINDATFVFLILNAKVLIIKVGYITSWKFGNFWKEENKKITKWLLISQDQLLYHIINFFLKRVFQGYLWHGGAGMEHAHHSVFQAQSPV